MFDFYEATLHLIEEEKTDIIARDEEGQTAFALCLSNILL